MGSSSGSNYGTPPAMPMPNAPVAPFGQSASWSPRFVNFLPSDPNAMATGLTPAMLGQIDQPAQGPPPATAAAAAAAAPGPNPQQIQQARNAMAEMIAQNNQQQGYQGRASGPNAMYGGWNNR
jgi:hypothetical protein